MGSNIYQTRAEVYVGDTGPVLELLITEPDGYTVRNLSGFAAWVAFWFNGDAEPRVTRAAKVYNASSGLVRYYFEGDEYATTGECIFRCSVQSTEWGGASVGRGFFQASTPVLKRRVLAQP